MEETLVINGITYGEVVSEFTALSKYTGESISVEGVEFNQYENGKIETPIGYDTIDGEDCTIWGSRYPVSL
jgi:hypothetical protein